jgi:anaerobic magnesium-protoporphyrin IX monomethyl ester cyclase
MARVFLLNPPSPEPVRTPLLSFCHLAASLRTRGHEVALLDASAPFAPQDIRARVAAFSPDLVGLHVKTLHAQPAYACAAELREFTLVAGGPHATIAAAETLAHGFRYAIRGEGEDALCELADGADLGSIKGLSWIDRGMVRHNVERPFNTELDRLAPPLSALDLFDPAWYGATTTLPPAGLLSSRGCPAACTFCSNDVTGRKFRYRSAKSVADEIALLRDRFAMPAFSFFDDSFAVGKRRVKELCDAIGAIGTRTYWTCTAHPSHLDRDVIADMQRAGCGGIDIGMESADPSMLLKIGKGVTVERVLDVLGWAKELGVHTVVNLMFGWPDETDEELDATIAFLDRAADVAGGFNARGVVVPYPGTQIYKQNHERFGFTSWWLNEPPLDYPEFPRSWDRVEIERAYATDPALDRNFFAHPPHRVEKIRAALMKKATVTMAIQQRRMERLHAEPWIGVPAAGAR